VSALNIFYGRSWHWQEQERLHSQDISGDLKTPQPSATLTFSALFSSLPISVAHAGQLGEQKTWTLAKGEP